MAEWEKRPDWPELERISDTAPATAELFNKLVHALIYLGASETQISSVNEGRQYEAEEGVFFEDFNTFINVLEELKNSEREELPGWIDLSKLNNGVSYEADEGVSVKDMSMLVFNLIALKNAFSSEPDTPTEGLAYTISDDGTYYTCTGIGTATDTDIVIASEIDGVPVTSIGSSAFKQCSSLTSVVIPYSIISIGSEAFYGCSKLTSITVGKNNTAYQSIDGNLYTKDGATLIQYAIGKTATKFVIPEGVTTIGDRAFIYCGNLTNVVIPNSVTSIGASAFWNCDSLTSVVIPNSVTSIRSYVFWNCDSLTIYCETESKPSGWNSDWNRNGGTVVWDCNYNDVATDGYIYVVVDEVRYRLKDGEAAVAKQPHNLTVANIPESITYKDVEYSVTEIGNYAFSDCSNLTNVAIPDSVTTIGSNAFDNTAYYNDENNWVDNVLYAGKHLIRAKDVSGAYTIKEGTKCIAAFAFMMSKLTSVVIPDSVISGIDAQTFLYCHSLESVVIGNGVTHIGRSAFSDCEKLTNLTIGNSVTSIGVSAFFSCEALTSVVIPDSVTRILDGAFYFCKALKSVVIGNGVTYIDDNAFGGCKKLTSIRYTGDVASWKAIEKVDGWNDYVPASSVTCTDGTVAL